MNLDVIKIGSFIQNCRKELQITQSELGERLNVSAQSVSNWERGESLPDASLLMDLAQVLHCSVDSILLGGEGGIHYRRYTTTAQMRQALACIHQIGLLLGEDHFIYRSIIAALNERMNTTIEQAFSDQHIFEVFTLEFLIACIRNGDYVDRNDVLTNIQPCKARDYALNLMREMGLK